MCCGRDGAAAPQGAGLAAAALPLCCGCGCGCGCPLPLSLMPSNSSDSESSLSLSLESVAAEARSRPWRCDAVCLPRAGRQLSSNACPLKCCCGGGKAGRLIRRRGRGIASYVVRLIWPFNLARWPRCALLRTLRGDGQLHADTVFHPDSDKLLQAPSKQDLRVGRTALHEHEHRLRLQPLGVRRRHHCGRHARRDARAPPARLAAKPAVCFGKFCTFYYVMQRFGWVGATGPSTARLPLSALLSRELRVSRAKGSLPARLDTWRTTIL